jgi:biotin transporter BioY
MYIIAIAWLYVVTLMAATEKTVTAGLLTFIFYGLLPCALLLWVLGAKRRRNINAVKESLQNNVREPNSANTEADE